MRDRAILETFYSTGIRRMGLINLGLADIDAERGTLMVRQGKGKKDRMIPIGERALQWIGKYTDDVRRLCQSKCTASEMTAAGSVRANAPLGKCPGQGRAR